MEQDWITVLQQNQLEQIMATNEKTAQYGLVLRPEDAQQLLEGQANTLREQRRVVLHAGILEKLIDTFCNSDFINPENYVATLMGLQEIFYLYKNETQDQLTDDELLHLMREQYERICFGDLEYLGTTCLQDFAQAVRAGYRGYQATDGYGESGRFDEVARWDYNLYMETLKDLLGWR